MGRYIVALHAGHNSSALIGDASGIHFAVQEERITREKNFWGLPRNALRACLDHVGASPQYVYIVAYGGRQGFARYHSREDVIEAYRRQTTLLGKLRQRLAMPLLVGLKPTLGQDKLHTFLAEEGMADAGVVFHAHHLTHAATAYYGLR